MPTKDRTLRNRRTGYTSNLHKCSPISDAILLGALLLLGTVSAGLQSAYAAGFVSRFPPYDNPWSTGTYAYSDTSGKARVKSSSFGLPVFAQARHNGDPSLGNPDMHITQYRNLYFYSNLNGKFMLDANYQPCCAISGAEMRYGGWTVMQRPADGAWIKDYYFYVYQQKNCPGSCGPTTYNVPPSGSGSVTVTFVKGYNAGHYSIASLFDAISWGTFLDPQQFAIGTADAYTTSQGREMKSNLLAIEWCDNGSC